MLRVPSFLFVLSLPDVENSLKSDCREAISDKYDLTITKTGWMMNLVLNELRNAEHHFTIYNENEKREKSEEIHETTARKAPDIIIKLMFLVLIVLRFTKILIFVKFVTLKDRLS